jgi:protoheme IX farnesyltransferase
VTNQFDLAALMLFVILVIWQMPHFYAIALFRTDDYRAAGIPVLPIKRGIQQTKMQILLYIIAFVLVVSSLTYFRYTGYSYLVILLTVSIVWLGLAIKGFNAAETHKWARKMFFFSLLVIVFFSGMLIMNFWLP